jgi:hypothetical protein
MLLPLVCTLRAIFPNGKDGYALVKTPNCLGSLENTLCLMGVTGTCRLVSDVLMLTSTLRSPLVFDRT